MCKQPAASPAHADLIAMAMASVVKIGFAVKDRAANAEVAAVLLVAGAMATRLKQRAVPAARAARRIHWGATLSLLDVQDGEDEVEGSGTAAAADDDAFACE